MCVEMVNEVIEKVKEEDLVKSYWHISKTKKLSYSYWNSSRNKWKSC